MGSRDSSDHTVELAKIVAVEFGFDSRISDLTFKLRLGNHLQRVFDCLTHRLTQSKNENDVRTVNLEPVTNFPDDTFWRHEFAYVHCVLHVIQAEVPDFQSSILFRDGRRERYHYEERFHEFLEHPGGIEIVNSVAALAAPVPERRAKLE